jgi:hypothetical protein
MFPNPKPEPDYYHSPQINKPRFNVLNMQKMLGRDLSGDYKNNKIFRGPESIDAKRLHDSYLKSSSVKL